MGAFFIHPRIPCDLPISQPVCYIVFVKPKRETPIIKVTAEGAEGVVDEVAAEMPLRLVLNNKPLVTLLCTPTELDALAVGFLLSEGILRDKPSLRRLEIDRSTPAVMIEVSDLPDDWENMFEKKTISSGCGRGITFTNHRIDLDRKIGSEDISISVEDIRVLLRTFRNISSLYIETGGVHSAALSDGKGILFFSEDVGRHNAVDKLIGKAFMKDMQVENKILLTSGRVTSEIITKAGRNRFPIVISRAAASCMAVSYAEDMGITLIGFARGDRMNIYTWPNRIRF